MYIEMHRRYMTGTYVRIEDSIENTLLITFFASIGPSPIKFQTWVYDISVNTCEQAPKIQNSFKRLLNANVKYVSTILKSSTIHIY